MMTTTWDFRKYILKKTYKNKNIITLCITKRIKSLFSFPFCYYPAVLI